MSAVDRRQYFPIVVPVEPGSQAVRRVYRFACGKCGKTHDISANTLGGARRREDIDRVLKRGRWSLGNKPERDRCPDCTTALRASRRASLKSTVSRETIMNSAAQPAADITPVAADANRQIGIDEILLINDRLQEVYDIAARAYKGDWTDARIAAEMGIPREWVADIRKRKFGASGVNEAVLALASEARGVLSEVRSEVSAAETRWAALMHRVEDIGKRIAEIEKAVQ